MTFCYCEIPPERIQGKHDSVCHETNRIRENPSETRDRVSRLTARVAELEGERDRLRQELGGGDIYRHERDALKESEAEARADRDRLAVQLGEARAAFEQERTRRITHVQEVERENERYRGALGRIERECVACPCGAEQAATIARAALRGEGAVGAVEGKVPESSQDSAVGAVQGEGPRCEPWCGMPGIGGRGRAAVVVWNGPDRDDSTDYCTDACSRAGRPLHPAEPSR